MSDCQNVTDEVVMWLRAREIKQHEELETIFTVRNKCVVNMHIKRGTYHLINDFKLALSMLNSCSFLSLFPCILRQIFKRSLFMVFPFHEKASKCLVYRVVTFFLLVISTTCFFA